MNRLSLSPRVPAVVVSAVLLATNLASAGPALAAGPASGLVCTAGAPTFTLHATVGTVGIPDGNTITMWSYTADGAGSFQLPGPTLCVDAGQPVSVTLVDDLTEDVSIVFTGQSGVLADGAPAQPQFSGPLLTSLVQPAPAGGGTVTYTFTPTKPGTYIYESGTDPSKQIQMGLYGALIVRPAGHPAWAYDDPTLDPATGNPRTQFNPNAEFMLLLSEVDPDLHQAVERGLPYDWTAYHPRYWMINGRSFPDTIAPNAATWLPNQPYSALIHIPVKTAAGDPPALLRYLNVGTRNHPFHPHGQNALVLGRDGRELIGAGGEDLSYQKFTILVGAGQTVDSTYEFSDVEMWQPDTNPIPVTLPQLQNLTFKGAATWYAGSPYLGVQDELPTGVTSYNQCGEFYHVAHSHALDEAANYDAGFGGMLTLIRIDPPKPNTCS